MKKPDNWAVRNAAARLVGDHRSLPMPDFTEEQVAWLLASRPERCLRPNETVEDHLRYAGAAAFVKDIAIHMEQRVNNEVLTEEDLEDEDGGWIEPNGPGD